MLQAGHFMVYQGRHSEPCACKTCGPALWAISSQTLLIMSKENSGNLIDMNNLYGMRNKQFPNSKTSNLKLVWSSMAWCYSVFYYMKMKNLFNLYSDWLLQWGFPDGTGFVQMGLSYQCRKITEVLLIIIRSVTSNLSFTYVHKIS